MNETAHPNSFPNDERLANLDPKRLEMLMSYAAELSAAPSDRKMSVFLSITQRTARENISFTPEERSILIQVLTEEMSEEEKKRVKMLQTLVSRYSSSKS